MTSDVDSDADTVIPPAPVVPIEQRLEAKLDALSYVIGTLRDALNRLSAAVEKANRERHD